MSTELRLVVKMIQTTEVVKNVRECLSKAKKKKKQGNGIFQQWYLWFQQNTVFSPKESIVTCVTYTEGYQIL